MNSKRLFIAINLPEKTRQRIETSLLDEITQKGLKKVSTENLHITVKFLGYLPSEFIPTLKEKLGIVRESPSFEIELNGIGSFNQRVLWLGIKKGTTQLLEISKKINNALSLKEERFHAHITLARNKFLKRKEFNALMEKLKEKNFSAKIMAESIDLMESKLGEKGPKYSLLEKIPLKRL